MKRLTQRAYVTEIKKNVIHNLYRLEETKPDLPIFSSETLLVDELN